MNSGQILNGRFDEGPTIAVDPLEPCFAHGHGLFETFRVSDGRAIFLEDHIDRLAGTAELVGLQCPVDAAAVRRQVAELLHRLGFREARVKVHLLGRSDQSSDVLVTAEEVPAVEEFGPLVSVALADERFLGRNPLLGLKTMNYMVNRLAEQEGRERGFGEVVLAGEDGIITEGSRSSVFFVEGGRLLTPSLELPILPGITRQAIVRLAREEGIEVEEGFFPFDRLRDSDEAFLTGSFSGIRPMDRIEDVEMSPCPGQITRQLAAAYRRRIAAEERLCHEGAEG